MDAMHKIQDQQRELWNGSSGQAWVAIQATTDAMFAALSDRLAQEARPGERVLDVGCGAGATTRALAAAVGPDGHVTGVDISEPLIAAARAHGDQAEYVVADAGAHPFEPGAYDLLASRFGVMFFADPAAAFANLRRATRAGGRLRAITWRDPAENPFMTAAVRAARPLVGDLLPQPSPGAPGQFAFADADRVAAILGGAGWNAVEHRPFDAPCVIPEAELSTYLTRLGPLSLVLPQVDPAQRDHVVATVRAAFDEYVHGDEVRFTVACWMVEATA